MTLATSSLAAILPAAPPPAPPEPSRVVQHAKFYINRYGFKLVPIPFGSKGPNAAGWNKPGGYIVDAGIAAKHWTAHPSEGIGVVLDASGICSLDLDHVDRSREILGQFGVDIDALVDACPTVKGNPQRCRILFSAPRGVALSAHKLTWPRAGDPTKLDTLLELRAGPVQDVLPPSIHPGTGLEYVWVTKPDESFPELPEALRAIWLDWKNFESQARALCPWAAPPTLPVRRTDSVIEAFNAKNNVSDLLETHGYKRKGKKFLAPSSETGLAGVVVFEDGRCFSHHGSDLLADGHAHDAFDVHRLLKHGGDFKEAARAAAQELGLKQAAALKVPNRLPQDGAGGSADEWSELRPIQAELHPVAAFDPVALLPDALRDWVMDEADRMVCPPDFIAATVMVVLGSLIGARCAIKPKSRDDWVVVPNLWGGVVALPSAKKSPAIEAGLKPINKLIAKAMEEHKAELDDFEAASVAHAAKKEAIENRVKVAAKDSTKGNPDIIAKELIDHRRESPEAPTARRYKSNDATIEKLGELLRENHNGLLVLRDELVGLIASWDREGREGERAFFLEAWNGTGSFDTDRIGRGSIFIPNLCLSIFGGIQPDKLTAYLEQADHALANDGLLQRFQVLVYPNQMIWEWRDRAPNIDARAAVIKVFEVLNGFDPVAWGATPPDAVNKFPCFSFSGAAQELFIEWSSELQRVRVSRELVDGHPLVAQHLAKFEKLFAAIALILHLAECAATGRHLPQISEDAAARAASWCEYLESHARRCYGLLIDDGLRSAQALAEKVRQGKLPAIFTARDVRRNQWRYLTTSESVLAALDWLEGEGWVRGKDVDATQHGGRPTTVYSVNPKLQRSPGRGTVKTAETLVSAVTAAPNLGLSENLEG